MCQAEEVLIDMIKHICGNDFYTLVFQAKTNKPLAQKPWSNCINSLAKSEMGNHFGGGIRKVLIQALGYVTKIKISNLIKLLENSSTRLLVQKLFRKHKGNQECKFAQNTIFSHVGIFVKDGIPTNTCALDPSSLIKEGIERSCCLEAMNLFAEKGLENQCVRIVHFQHPKIFIHPNANFNKIVTIARDNNYTVISEARNPIRSNANILKNQLHALHEECSYHWIDQPAQLPVCEDFAVNYFKYLQAA